MMIYGFNILSLSPSSGRGTETFVVVAVKYFTSQFQGFKDAWNQPIINPPSTYHPSLTHHESTHQIFHSWTIAISIHHHQPSRTHHITQHITHHQLPSPAAITSCHQPSAHPAEPGLGLRWLQIPGGVRALRQSDCSFRRSAGARSRSAMSMGGPPVWHPVTPILGAPSHGGS